MRSRRSASRRWLAAASLLLAAADVRGVAADEPEEWEREAGPDVFYVSPEDAKGDWTHVVLRVVDDVTGEPLPGATVALHSQDEYPITGLVPAESTGTADEDGWVRIRVGGPDWLSAYWYYVEAPGHAGAAVRPGGLDPDDEVRLQRAQDVVVQVRDGIDRPVAGATIGARVSSTCGHMGDQRVVVTGYDGLAMIPALCRGGQTDWNFKWESWAVADGIESDYRDVDVPTRPRGPQVLRYSPSRPIVGVILDSAGKPLAGAHVGGGNSHRGPWARTDSEGRFRLVGAALDRTVEVVEDYEGMYAKDHAPYPTFDAPPPGVRRVFRMPPPGTPPIEEPTVDVQIVARDATSGATLDDAPLVAWRDEDGWTTRGAIRALPRGSFTVVAGGGLSPYAAARGRIEVEDAPPAPLVLDVTRNPEVRVALEDDPKTVRISLVSADDERTRGVADEVKAGRVPVPPGVECAFRVSFGDPNRGEAQVEFFPIPVTGRGPDSPPIHVHATRAAVVKARLAGPDGKVVEGWLLADVERHVGGGSYERWEPETPAQVEPAVSLSREGAVELLAVPEGSVLAPRIVAVTIPAGARGGAPVDLGLVRLEPRGDRRLTLLRADGKRAEAQSIRVVHEGVLRRLDPTEDDVYDPPLVPLAPGDEVVASARWGTDEVRVRTLRARLDGPGPWTIRGDEGRTSLSVDPRDEDGKGIDGILVIDGKPYAGLAYVDDEGKRGLVGVRGLEPGPHRVAVSATNRLARVYRIVLGAGEHRVLTPRLRAAPR